MKSKIKYPVGGYAPGHYANECVSCKEEFMGDKYARQCEPCAINTVNESNTKSLLTLRMLKSALKGIRFSNDQINKVLQESGLEGVCFFKGYVAGIDPISTDFRDGNMETQQEYYGK